MRTIRTIVVDDEPAARTRLVRLLATDPEIEVVAECRNGTEALEAIRTQAIELVYLDIQMPQTNGFEVAQKLLGTQAPFVIFVTAHDRYALKAFDVRAVDYLLKPYDDDRFFISLARAKDFIEMRDNKRLTGRLMDLMQDHLKTHQEFTEVFTIKEKGREYRVPVKDILWLQAEGNYIVLEAKARRYLLRMTMNMVESDLDPARFVRIHRSFVVNMAHVRSSRYSGNNEFTFTMSNGKHLLSGRSYKEAVARLLAEREQG
ncbi:MAG: response regulator transcription factor [Flavobacteriales bacterium]|nr:response regulator transcription factor [Flavobacteriales bacterium]MBP9081172.1 response regulator transcription factor [Flavobacteriales bacterium]